MFKIIILCRYFLFYINFFLKKNFPNFSTSATTTAATAKNAAKKKKAVKKKKATKKSVESDSEESGGDSEESFCECKKLKKKPKSLNKFLKEDV